MSTSRNHRFAMPAAERRELGGETIALISFHREPHAPDFQAAAYHQLPHVISDLMTIVERKAAAPEVRRSTPDQNEDAR